MALLPSNDLTKTLLGGAFYGGMKVSVLDDEVFLPRPAPLRWWHKVIAWNPCNACEPALVPQRKATDTTVFVAGDSIIMSRSTYQKFKRQLHLINYSPPQFITNA